MPAKTRSEAKRLGLKRYFTGKRCPHGHIAERLVSNGLCATCLNERAKTLQLAQRRAAGIGPRPPASFDKQAYMADWRLRNADHIRAYDRAAQARRLVEDVQYRLRLGLRTRLNMALRGSYRAGSAVRDLGCSIAEFRVHIEAQFQPGMTWANWGEWHQTALRVRPNRQRTVSRSLPFFKYSPPMGQG